MLCWMGWMGYAACHSNDWTMVVLLVLMTQAYHAKGYYIQQNAATVLKAWALILWYVYKF